MRVQQTLHGYAGGHRLIATSTRLEKRDAALMMDLSDATGRATVQFDGYLTGYPLPDSGWYVLARTWRATEMPRPGCVWTHSLLVPEHALRELESHAPLLGAFRRPGEEKNEASYKVPVELDLPSQSPSEPLPGRTTVASFLQWCYERWPDSVLVETQSAQDIEALLLATWWQQWPALRRELTFCTGALSRREYQGSQFRLLCGPRSSLGRLGAMWAEHEPQSAEQESPAPWAFVAAADLEARPPTALKRYVAELAGDHGSPNMFVPLVRLFMAEPVDLPVRAASEAHARRVIAMAREFPDSARSVALAVSRSADIDREVGVLRGVITAADDDLSLLGDVDIERRVGALWSVAPEDAVSLTAARLSTGADRQSVMMATAPHLSPATVAWLSRLAAAGGVEGTDADQVLSAVSSAYPQLALHASAWEGPWEAGQEHLLRRLLTECARGKRGEEELGAKIVSLLASKGVGPAAEQVFYALDAKAVDAFLEWATASDEADGGSKDLEPWWNQTGRRPAYANRWVARHDQVPVWLLRVLAGSMVREGGRDAFSSAELASWMPLLNTGVADDAVPAAATVMAIAHPTDSRASRMVDFGVGALYTRAKVNELSADVSRLLQQTLPAESWNRDWDLCERLVRALFDVMRTANLDPLQSHAARLEPVRASIERRIEHERERPDPWYHPSRWFRW
jgi:hypothetical protein